MIYRSAFYKLGLSYVNVTNKQIMTNILNVQMEMLALLGMTMTMMMLMMMI